MLICDNTDVVFKIFFVKLWNSVKGLAYSLEGTNIHALTKFIYNCKIYLQDKFLPWSIFVAFYLIFSHRQVLCLSVINLLGYEHKT